jgi:hypothetical protein
VYDHDVLNVAVTLPVQRPFRYPNVPGAGELCDFDCVRVMVGYKLTLIVIAISVPSLSPLTELDIITCRRFMPSTSLSFAISPIRALPEYAVTVAVVPVFVNTALYTAISCPRFELCSSKKMYRVIAVPDLFLLTVGTYAFLK